MLHVDAPLLQSLGASQFKLTIGVKKSTNLENFSPFPMTDPETSINPQGKLGKIELARPSPGESPRSVSRRPSRTAPAFCSRRGAWSRTRPRHRPQPPPGPGFGPDIATNEAARGRAGIGAKVNGCEASRGRREVVHRAPGTPQAMLLP